MKIFSDSKLKKTDYIAIALLGVLLLVIAVPTGSNITIGKNGDIEETMSENEEKLTNILENMEGVGAVKVMITTAGTSQGLLSDEKKEVEGVVIVAEGAGKASVDKKIIDVVMALFNVEVHKIKIVKMSL